MPKSKVRVFVAVPTRGTIASQTTLAMLGMGKTKVFTVKTFSSSLLTLSFNTLWCEALNLRPKFTHFVMLHDDVWPLDDAWLDKLVLAHTKGGADITSAVIPIKDKRGISSTAFFDPATRELRRLTMQEAVKLPKTFTAAEAGFPARYIFPNTGLWICDFTKSWVERICFTMRDRINRGPNGEFVAQCFSEDWGLGHQAMDLGLKVCATTALQISHKGSFDFPNCVGWGEWAEDQDTAIWNPPDWPRPDFIVEV